MTIGLALSLVLLAQSPGSPSTAAVPPFIDPVFDSSTNLLWTKPAKETVVEATIAASYCQKLEIGNLDNWRLPTAEEVGKLEHFDSTSRRYRSPQALDLGERCYFSSNKDDYGIANLYYCFAGGGFRALDSPNRVLCVHSVSR